MGISASKTEIVVKKGEIDAERAMCLNLNDDCIEAILCWLPLADLCSLSLTCKRAFQLTNQYFHHRYRNHGMEISNKLSGPAIKFSENYVKCFRSNIRNIRLTSDYWNLNAVHLFTFLRMNCSEQLRELELDTINLKCDRFHRYGEQIHAQLKNLTTISFINCTMHDIHHGFLQHCDQLRHLIVKDEGISIEGHCERWMQETYPHLESLVYYVSESMAFRMYNDDALIQFLQRHPHIRNVASDHRIVWIISQANINLDYLVVRIEHKVIFRAIFSDLKSLCEQRRIPVVRLEFGIYVTFSEEMTNDLENLGTYATLDLSFAFKDLQLDVNHPTMHQRFNNVRSLRLEVARPIPDSVFHQLPDTMPDVEEIHLQPWFKDFIVNFRPCIGTFAARSKRLKTLVIHRIDPDIIPPDAVIEMDFWREKLSGACPLTIYLPYDVIQKIKFIIPVGSRVNIKPISALKRDIFTSDRRLI